MSKPEVFVSIDIETDGPAPGLNSMLALGAAAFEDDDLTAPADTFYAKMPPLPGLFQATDTMDWWTTQPEAWAEVNRDQQNPEEVMQSFDHWCRTMEQAMACKLVAVAGPAAFDFAFVNHYCHRFVGRNPLGFACLDIRSYANGLAGYQGYYGLAKQHLHAMTGAIDMTGLRPHVALDDAIEQGRLFMALRRHAAETTPGHPRHPRRP